jgi:hypothetical protein
MINILTPNTKIMQFVRIVDSRKQIAGNIAKMMATRNVEAVWSGFGIRAMSQLVIAQVKLKEVVMAKMIIEDCYEFALEEYFEYFLEYIKSAIDYYYKAALEGTIPARLMYRTLREFYSIKIVPKKTRCEFPCKVRFPEPAAICLLFYNDARSTENETVLQSVTLNELVQIWDRMTQMELPKLDFLQDNGQKLLK